MRIGEKRQEEKGRLLEQSHHCLKRANVMRIGSTVRGEICKGKDALDAIEAVLLAGTLSGAPKIRAYQLIGELENNKRGIYGGVVGYIDFTGNMDTCIAIVFIRSGAACKEDGKNTFDCRDRSRSEQELPL